MRFDFKHIAPLLLSCGFFFVSVFGGFLHSPVDNVQQLVSILVFSQEKKSTDHSTLPSYKVNSRKNIYFCFVDCFKVFDCVDNNKLLFILDHLTLLIRNLYAGQEATVQTGHGTTDWFQIGKGLRQGCILSPCLFNLYAEYIMKMLG